MWAEETSILSICTKCDGRRDLSWVEEEKFHNRTYHMADERLPTSVHIAIPYGSKARNLVEVIDNVLALISRNAVDEVVDVTEKEGAEQSESQFAKRKLMFVRNLKTLLEGKKRILEKRSLGMYCKASDWTLLDEIDEKANIDCRRRVSVKAPIREQLVRNSLSKEYILVSKDDYDRRKDR